MMSMESSDYLLVSATFFAPFFAIQAQKLLEIYREKRERKLWIFRTLMANRRKEKKHLSHNQIEALNLIPLEFNDKKGFKIIEALDSYRDVLYNAKYKERNFKAWEQESYNYFIAIIKNMSDYLKFKFNESDIRCSFYCPYNNVQKEINDKVINEKITEILQGNKSLSIKIENLKKK